MPDIFLGETPISEEKPVLEEEAVKEQEIQAEKEPLITTRKTKPFAFSAFKEAPSNIYLNDILEEEELLLFLRKHFVTNFIWILNALILISVPIILYLIHSLGLFSINFIPFSFIAFFLVFYYFFLISGFIFVHLITWFYNISIVTNKRIIDIDFASLVFENVDATTLSKVEDVGYAQIGIIRSVFDYGDVHVQTAGASSNFDFLAVPKPERVVRIIHDLMGKGKHG